MAVESGGETVISRVQVGSVSEIVLLLGLQKGRQQEQSWILQEVGLQGLQKGQQ